MKKNIVRLLLLLVAGAGVRCSPSPEVYTDSEGRQGERLDRGFVALVRRDVSVYLGWRLLEDDPEDVSFNLYRKIIGAVPHNDYVKINDEPIVGSTNYLDRGGVEYPWLEGDMPKIHEAHNYKLTRIVNGVEEDVPGGETYAYLSFQEQNYRSILLNDSESFVHKIGIGDLDGDGAYDYVVLLQPLQYVDPGTCEDCWSRSRDTFKMEAYNSKGEFLWRYDMGWAIETGLWYAPFIVYDLDGDGKAEVYTKAGEGDPRELDGHVISGPEYLVKIDGETGRIVQKRDWISRNIERTRSYDWTNRNFMSLAYLDGKKPSLLMQRGNYGIIRIEAMDENLETEWMFECTDENDACWGGGGHNIMVADINGDGKDELIPGTFALDNEGKLLWSLGLKHNDGGVVTDIDPGRPGLEIFYNIESGVPRNGVCMVDAATGKYLMEYDQPTRHVHDRAVVADFDPAYPGMECYVGPDRDGDDPRPFLFSAKGERLSDSFYLNAGALYWDDDEYKELISGNNIYKFRGDTLQRNVSGGYVADIFGDWREEVIAFLPGEIRIYSSTIPADNRKVCLMQNHQYRMGVAAFSVGYPDAPQLGPSGKTPARSWGDKLQTYATEEYMPAGKYIWDWAPATMLRSIANRWEEGIDPEGMLGYVRRAMDASMDKADGIHPNAVASAFGMAFMARVTGEEKYKRKSFEIYEQYLAIPKSSNGGVSHRDNTIELWDDTVYMISLFLTEMYRLTGDEKYLREAAFQIMAHAEKLEDPETGLWYHGWDDDNADFDDGCSMAGWADNPLRRSNEFWGRANGWVAMALADILHLMPSTMREREPLKAVFTRMMGTLSGLQDEKTGHWYQLPAYPGEEGNFIESSCTVMFGYAICSGIIDGILPAGPFLPLVERAFAGIGKYSLKNVDDRSLTISNVCDGTCVGDKDYYYARRVVDGTHFALGAAVMFHDRYRAMKQTN